MTLMTTPPTSKTPPNLKTSISPKASPTPSDKIFELLNRGVDQVLPSRDSLTKLLKEKRRIKVYLGIDPTGSLLTLGHSVVLRKLQQFANLGHQVILLIGNGTVRIGDPTGKDVTRPVMTDEEINKNFANWRQQAQKVLDFDKIEIRHNADWLDKLTYQDIIKLLAKTTVQQLLERDMFQKRIDQKAPIFGHEIIYPLLQGYDSVVMDVDLEIGGSDQTFNMMMGRTLQRAYNNKDKWVLTTPLINGTDGRKMSKSLNNFIALNENYIDMYGKIMSIADEMIIDYFWLLTDVNKQKIDTYQEELSQDINPMQIKKILAWEITKMYHSAKEANLAQNHFYNVVQKKQIPQETLEVTIANNKLKLIEIMKLCLPQESSSNLKRLIQQSAVELIPQKIKPSDADEVIDLEKTSIMRIGKRYFFKLIRSEK